MSVSEKWKWVYRVVRSVLFTAVGLVALIFVALYITLSIPAVQREVRNVAEKELSALVGSTVEIKSVEIFPFNEVVVRGLTLSQPEDASVHCLEVEKVGAGISLWDLVMHRRIIITYAELIGLDARIWQAEKDAPLNIQFLIDAFAPKDKSKPPTKFDLQIHNVVIRKGEASFERRWMAERPAGQFDPARLHLSSLNADVMLPRLSNDDISIDLRRLAFSLSSGPKGKEGKALDVERLSAKFSIINKDISISNLRLQLPSTLLTVSDLTLPLSKYPDFPSLLSHETFNISLDAENLSPSEFAIFHAPLAEFRSNLTLHLKAQGNMRDIAIPTLELHAPASNFKLAINDASLTPGEKLPARINLPELHLEASSQFLNTLTDALLPDIPEKTGAIIRNAADIKLDLSAEATDNLNNASADIDLTSSACGSLSIKALAKSIFSAPKAEVSINTEGFNPGKLFGTDQVGKLRFDLQASCASTQSPEQLAKSFKGSSAEAIAAIFPSSEVELNLKEAEVRGNLLTDITLSLIKSGNGGNFHLESADPDFNLNMDGGVTFAAAESSITLNSEIIRLHPSALSLLPPHKDFDLSGMLSLDLQGDRADNLSGSIHLDDVSFTDISGGRSISLEHLDVAAHQLTNDMRILTLNSDWINGQIAGHFIPSRIPDIVRSMLAEAFPALIPPPAVAEQAQGDAALDFHFTITRAGEWMDYLKLPVKLLYEANLSGNLDESRRSINIDFSAPYIQQGRDKLIQNTRLSASLADARALLNAYSSIPTKKGVLDLDVQLGAEKGLLDLKLGFNPDSYGAFYGDLLMQARLTPTLDPGGMDIALKVLPSSIFLNHADWKIGKASILCTPGQIKVDGLSISHDRQFLTIGGIASASPDDEMVVRLQDIDLKYIFETLNIDVAMFGGYATGEAVGKGLFSKDIQAFTRSLHVDSLSYNNALLGDGELRGDFDLAQKRVGIFADISERGRHVANVDGGIWIGRDSLSFAFDADKVRIGFLQPFMKAFSSKVEGRASGQALLYGTFKDVNMKGRMFADTVAIKVDFTNVTYCGSDSIIIDPGVIRIPAFTLRDEYGNTAVLTGELEHDYFHHPEFDFRITRARSLMLYDTNASINPIWYGRIFGSGTGRIVGNDDYVRIIADMVTEQGSAFTFVLDDAKEAIDYSFLTFTDKERERREAETPPEELSEPDEIVRAFRKKVAEQAPPPSVFSMDIRATLTPAAKMTLVMDPVAGDKINARGEGPINISYDTASDEMKMYGKYTLSEGTYNFSLQDLILKDFLIKEGSTISFNGDPMSAMLNIRAAYRVNTNLTDLDASFATDKDLNRVNVPVDAMLLVSGEMEHPDIHFDIELPTLNGEVEQKVRSIISSEDMMNTQMIYLLALNRFYTPEYTGSNSGGEWASVASSTLSSQLQNILGQLTDKVTLAPSLRSDKGDFSDLQVDLALSSRLFNNRLLINGNFGYRDRSTSSTTFVGDFDIEYLLNRRGNLRLKAYNHFNDQNYYLKSALTTQGVGVVWTREFDRLIPRRRKKQK